MTVKSFVLITAVAGMLMAGGPMVAVADASSGTGMSAPAQTPPVNLNTATAADLEKLPGIGPATAARIVEYRKEKGPFKKIEELMNVKGIGEKTFLSLKPRITVAPPKHATS
jgi:competence protein ComEA